MRNRCARALCRRGSDRGIAWRKQADGQLAHGYCGIRQDCRWKCCCLRQGESQRRRADLEARKGISQRAQRGRDRNRQSGPGAPSRLHHARSEGKTAYRKLPGDFEVKIDSEAYQKFPS